MGTKLLNIGLGCVVVADRVVAVLSPNSSPMKRLREEAREAKRLIDTTQNRKMRSIIVTDSNHVILSANHVETIAERINSEAAAKVDLLPKEDENR
ncbi:MAG: DUF370 domain-containing protein [Desulfobacterota bacterium]|nr:DUF370 domain-containing protein [Thermodesulfobacteriota bacterium]